MAACSSRAATLTASPGDERLALAADDDLAGVDADPRLETMLGDRVAHLGGGPNCAKRVVLVRDGDPEHGHDRVADELLDRPSVPLEDRAQILEVPPHARAQRFRIRRLAERRRSDEVAEEDRDDLALLARRLGQGEAVPHALQKRASVRVLAPTAGAVGTRGVYEGRPARSSSSTARDRAADTTLPFCSWNAIARSTARHGLVDAVDACEHLAVDVVDERLQLQEVDRLGERDRLVEQRERLVVSSESRERPRSRRSPSRLCVEIVHCRDGPTRVGELDRLVGAALEGEGVREDRIHRRAHADVADREEHVVCRVAARTPRDRDLAR